LLPYEWIVIIVRIQVIYFFIFGMQEYIHVYYINFALLFVLIRYLNRELVCHYIEYFAVLFVLIRYLNRELVCHYIEYFALLFVLIRYLNRELVCHKIEYFAVLFVLKRKMFVIVMMLVTLKNMWNTCFFSFKNLRISRESMLFDLS
jgi:hypothetical protein